MNCWKSQPLLAAYVDGELGRSEAEAVEDHLASCDECSALFEKIAALPELEFPTFGSDVEDELWAELDRRIQDGLADDRQRPLKPSTWKTLSALPNRLWYGEVSMPGGAAVGYAAVLLVLVGWGLGQANHAAELDRELAQKQTVVRALAEQVAASARTAPNNRVAAPGLAVPADQIRRVNADPFAQPGFLADEQLPTPALDPDFAPLLGGQVMDVDSSVPVGPVLLR